MSSGRSNDGGSSRSCSSNFLQFLFSISFVTVIINDRLNLYTLNMWTVCMPHNKHPQCYKWFFNTNGQKAFNKNRKYKRKQALTKSR